MTKVFPTKEDGITTMVLPQLSAKNVKRKLPESEIIGYPIRYRNEEKRIVEIELKCPQCGHTWIQ